MPHYIWQSNLSLIISVEKAEERKCRLTFKAQTEFFGFFSSVFSASRVCFVLFLLDLVKLQLMCSSAGFDTGAAF